jgi:hypothetical protein
LSTAPSVFRLDVSVAKASGPFHTNMAAVVAPLPEQPNPPHPLEFPAAELTNLLENITSAPRTIPRHVEDAVFMGPDEPPTDQLTNE